MERKWHYLENQFEIGTRYSFKKAYKISLFHDTRLHDRATDHPTDTDYQEAYTEYHPLHLALSTAFSNWKAIGGLQKGETLTLTQLLALLPARINNIDAKIQVVHLKGSPRWVQLFPNKHLPFYTGSQNNRIKAVESLSTAIGSEPALAAVKTEVDAKYDELIVAKTSQISAIDYTDSASNILEKARVEAMECQYKNLGLFIHKFPQNPDLIESLFDVSTLTNPEQTIWKGHLEPLENHPTLIHTFESGDMIRLKSTGNGDIKAYLASTPGGVDSTPVEVTSHHELTFDVADFHVTNYAVNRYLTIINKSDTKETRFLVELY
jgi:hypothetical protein